MKIPTDWYDFENSFQEVSYKYNGLNQLTNATIGNTTANYTYNAAGLRTSKTVNENTIKHIWDGQSLIAETDADGEIISEYVRGINLLAVEKDNKRTYYLYNGHGDIVQLADENGEVVKNYYYDAFGNEDNIDQNDTNPFRYGGEYYDSETGLYYLRARYYDPKTGRFTTEDSYWGKEVDPLSLNLYTFCTNNPINFIDPSGHENKALGYAGGYTSNWGGSSEISLNFGSGRYSISKAFRNWFNGVFNSGVGSYTNNPEVIRNIYFASDCNNTVSGFIYAFFNNSSNGDPNNFNDDDEQDKAKIEYGELDSLGRPTGIKATITIDMIGTGSSASSSIKPPGFLGGGKGGAGHARGHLLGKQLGGSGKDSRNLVTLYQNPTNTPVMRGFENLVRKAIEGGQTVNYSVTPIYEGNSLMPSAVTINAIGDGGFQLHVSILNRK